MGTFDDRHRDPETDCIMDRMIPCALDPYPLGSQEIQLIWFVEGFGLERLQQRGHDNQGPLMDTAECWDPCQNSGRFSEHFHALILGAPNSPKVGPVRGSLAP